MDELPQDFTEFVRRRAGALQRTAWWLTGDWPSAEDLVQATLLKCWKRWVSIQSKLDPDAYVRRIMMTTFLSSQRRRWRFELPSPTPAEEATVLIDQFADVDLRATVEAWVRKLPPRQRAVIVLRYFGDLSEASTAAALGCSVGTVKSHNARAIRALRELSKAKDDETRGARSE